MTNNIREMIQYNNLYLTSIRNSKILSKQGSIKKNYYSTCSMYVHNNKTHI